jgi:hypothetical protein
MNVRLKERSKTVDPLSSSPAPQPDQLITQRLHLFLKSPESLEQACLSLLGFGDCATLAAIRYELRAVQMKALDVRGAPDCQRTQGPILVLYYVGRRIVVQRMKKTLRQVIGPEVALELVARMTGVNPILRFLGAASGARLEMVERQFGAHVLFGNSAVGAAKAKSLPQGLAIIGSHRATCHPVGLGRL